MFIGICKGKWIRAVRVAKFIPEPYPPGIRVRIRVLVPVPVQSIKGMCNFCLPSYGMVGLR